MPLYEYVCRKCSHPFEELVFGRHEPRCPSCDARAVERVLSVPAARPRELEAAAAPSPCGSCGHPDGPGACRFD